MTFAPLFSLAGKTALVTGASRGLGRAMAEALAEASANVVCASSRLEGTAETANAIRALGCNAWQVAGDLADRATAIQIADEAESLAGAVHILVNNAGVISRKPALDYPIEAWTSVLETNLTSAFVLAQRLGAGMVERGGGKIINVASILSFSGGISVPAYTASKHGIAGLTKALANEWAQHGVQVNAIAPGYFATDNTSVLRADRGRAPDILARIPAGRWGDARDLAGAVVFLASGASDYVNGHVLVVDGGWMAR